MVCKSLVSGRNAHAYKIFKMPVAYSEDLRWRIVWLNVLQGVRARDVARRMQISERTVHRYAERFRVTGYVRRSLKRNGPLRSLSEHEELLLMHFILSYPGVYLRELQQMLYSSTRRIVDTSTICRTLHRLGMTRQRIKHISLRQSQDRRAQFIAEMAVFDVSMLLWIDESGFDRRNSVRKYGYGIRGQPPQDHTLILRGKRYSAIGIMSAEGVKDVYITDGTVDGDRFVHFIRHTLLPILQPFDGRSPHSVVILDNASIHKVREVIELLSGCGVIIKFLPAYSPDLNPIEEVFAEAKHFLQANDLLLNTTLSPEALILMAFNSITTANCCAYIKNSGYNIIM